MTTLRLPPLPILIRGTTLVMTLAAAFTLAQLTWYLVPESDTVGAVTPPPVISVPAAAERGAALLEVAEMHLFGRPQAGITTAAAPIEAPETRLNLTLRGVIASRELRAMAIVADPRGDERPYPVGAELPGGAVLVEIHPDRVILRRGGRYEALRLPRESGVTAARPAAAARPTAASAGTVAVNLAEFRQQLLNNPADLGRLANVQPVMEAGTLKGYRIEPRQNAALLTQAGLRPGDVVVGVNGIPLNDAARMGDVLKQLSSAGRLDVEVERAGRTERIAIDLGT